MRIKHYIFRGILIVGCFVPNVQAQVDALRADDQTQTERLKHIRLLNKTYPSIQLPFQFNALSPLPITSFTANYGIDTLVFGAEAPCGIIGVVPDTSLYFGFFYLKASDAELPSFISYDKTGELITNSLLFEDCWQDCPSDCHAQLKIDADLSIEFQFEEYQYECEFGIFEPEFDGTFPIKASKCMGYRKFSKIDSRGAVVERETVMLTNLELRKCEKDQRKRRQRMNQ